MFRQKNQIFGQHLGKNSAWTLSAWHFKPWLEQAVCQVMDATVVIFDQQYSSSDYINYVLFPTQQF